MQIYLVGFLVLAVAIATFAIRNSGEAVVKFIGWQFHSSLVVVVLVSVAVGVVMAVLLSLPGTFRLRARSREQAQRIVELEERLQELESKRAESAPGRSGMSRRYESARGHVGACRSSEGVSHLAASRTEAT